MPRPFVKSAFAASERDAATVFGSSAIILRRAARSSAFGSEGASLILVLSLSRSVASSSSISKSSESPSSSSTALSRPSISSSISSSSEPSSFRSSAPSSFPFALNVPLSLKVNFANFSSSPLSNASSLSISSSASDCCLSRSSSGSAYSSLSDPSGSLWLANGLSSSSASRRASRLTLAPVY